MLAAVSALERIEDAQRVRRFGGERGQRQAGGPEKE